MVLRKQYKIWKKNEVVKTVKMAVTGVQCAKAMGTRMNGISGRTTRSKKARRMSRSLARTGKIRRYVGLS